MSGSAFLCGPTVTEVPPVKEKFWQLQDFPVILNSQIRSKTCSEMEPP
jgi:hypothetical protein